MESFYTPDRRALQGRFGTRRLADTQERGIVSDRLSEADRAFFVERDMLFRSTVDATGHPVQLELLERARTNALAWLEARGGMLDDYVFPSRRGGVTHIRTRQDAHLVDR